MTDHQDPLESDRDVSDSEAARQKQAEMVEQFNEFKVKYPELYEWMYNHSNDVEERATEALINSKSPEQDIIYRQQIAACRFYQDWVQTGLVWLDDMRREEDLSERM